MFSNNNNNDSHHNSKATSNGNSLAVVDSNDIDSDNMSRVKLAKRVNSSSPVSMLAAVSSFNISKHQKSLTKSGSQNSDTNSSSNSSVNSSSSAASYSKSLGNKRSTNCNSDDELCSKSEAAYNQYLDTNYENYEDSQSELYSQPAHHTDFKKLTDKMGQFYHNQLPLLNCIKNFESPINHSQIQYDCTAPIARNSPENNEVKLFKYRHEEIASFCVDGKELICLPQAFEMFLKHLVGGLHTVYTKLKRLDIVPIVCNVEQVRVLRGLGAIQPGVNRCKLIAPSEFDTLYEDCTNSGSRPGRPPKRHNNNLQNDSAVSDSNHHNNTHNNNNDDSSPPSTPQAVSKSTPAHNSGKSDASKQMTCLNIKLDNQLNHSSTIMMSPYPVSSNLKAEHSIERRHQTNIMPNITSPCFYPQKPRIDEQSQSAMAAALNSFNYMKQLGLFPSFSNSSLHTASDNPGSFNSAAALAALRLLQPQLQPNYQLFNQEMHHMPGHHFPEYVNRNLNNLPEQPNFPNREFLNQQQQHNLLNQSEMIQKSCNRIHKESLLTEQMMEQQKPAKTFTDASRQHEASTRGIYTNRTIATSNEDASTDFEDDYDKPINDDDEKNRKKIQAAYLHPLSVDFLIGSNSSSSSSSNASNSSSSRNDSIDVITNPIACSSSSASSSSSSSSSLSSNNNYGQHLFSSTRSSPAILNDKLVNTHINNNKNNNVWPIKDSDLIQNNSLLYICSLINIVKNSVCKLDTSFKNDLENLRSSLQAEKLQRLKCDSKIHHLIRLQNILRNKLRSKSRVNLAKTRRRRPLIKKRKQENSVQIEAKLTMQSSETEN